jgi:hypothetical protein
LGVLENLYTCLREAAPAKAGHHLSKVFCYLPKCIAEVTSGDIACCPSNISKTRLVKVWKHIQPPFQSDIWANMIIFF